MTSPPQALTPAPTGRPFFRSAFLFAAIGATNNLISYLLFALFVHVWGVDPVVAVTITYALGMIVSFFGNRKLTFRHTGHVGRTVAKFLLVNAVGYGVNVVILRVFVHGLGFPALVVQLFAIVVVASITFFSMRLWVFREAGVDGGATVTERSAVGEAAAAVAAVFSPPEDRPTRRRTTPTPFVVVTMVFAAAMLVTLANLVFNPTLGSRVYSFPIAIGGAVILLALVPAFLRACGRISDRLTLRTRRQNVVALALAMVVAFAVSAGLGLLTLRSPGFDASIVFGSAQNLTLGRGLDPGEVLYYSMYPNNVFLTLTMWKFLSLIHLAGISGPPALFYAALVVVNAAFLTVGVLLTFLVTKRFAGLRLAVFTLLPSLVLVVVSPWIGTVYSDTLGLVFPILIVFLYLVSEEAPTRARRLLWWALIGLVTAVGYELKPTTVFALVAIALVALIRTRVRALGVRALLGPVSSIVAAVLVLGVAHVSLGAIENRSGTVPFDLADSQKAFPLTHFLKMGSHGLGGYDDDDVRETRAIPTEQGKFEAGLDGYVSNVTALGPVGYADFLGAKALRILGDGTFYQWQEGGQTNLPFIVQNPLGRLAQSFYGPAGAAHGALLDLWQAFWFALLALLTVPLFVRSRLLFGDSATILRVALLGLVVFLLLFEGRSRYLYLYLPSFVVLAALSASAVEVGTRDLRGRITRRKLPPRLGARGEPR